MTLDYSGPPQRPNK